MTVNMQGIYPTTLTKEALNKEVYLFYAAYQSGYLHNWTV